MNDSADHHELWDTRPTYNGFRLSWAEIKSYPMTFACKVILTEVQLRSTGVSDLWWSHFTFWFVLAPPGSLVRCAVWRRLGHWSDVQFGAAWVIGQMWSLAPPGSLVRCAVWRRLGHWSDVQFGAAWVIGQMCSLAPPGSLVRCAVWRRLGHWSDVQFGAAWVIGQMWSLAPPGSLVRCAVWRRLGHWSDVKFGAAWVIGQMWSLAPPGSLVRCEVWRRLCHWSDVKFGAVWVIGQMWSLAPPGQKWSDEQKWNHRSDIELKSLWLPSIWRVQRRSYTGSGLNANCGRPTAEIPIPQVAPISVKKLQHCSARGLQQWMTTM